MKTPVLITLEFEGEHWRRLRDALGDEVEIIRADKADGPAIASALERAEIAFLNFDPDTRFYHAPRLRWIHADHAGLNKAAVPEAFRPGLTVTGSAGRSAPVLAEHVLFFALALLYRFPAFLDAQRNHQWGIPGQEDLRGLYGKTIGILGMGHTGKALAIRAKAFGMRVLAYRRRDAAPPEGVDVIYSLDRGETPDALFREADVVAAVLNLSNTSHHMIDRRALGLMKKTALVINLARGGVIDEAALLEALRSGEIGGAGLDTFATEPLPADSPMWDAPNLLMTPHLTPAVPDRRGRSLDVMEENIRRYRAGAPMLNVLTPEDVYTPDALAGA